jgi:hypothetical protein
MKEKKSDARERGGGVGRKNNISRERNGVLYRFSAGWRMQQARGSKLPV